MHRDPPLVILAALPHADGSAHYEHCGYKVLATVNGPIQPQRRDELPEEAFLEVCIRESSGSGGPRTRLIESILHRTLLPLLDVASHPRTLMQLTLQIIRTPSDDHSTAPSEQHESLLSVLPHTINTAVCALLNGNVAMKTAAIATGVWTYEDGAVPSNETLSRPTIVERNGLPSSAVRARHVFAYTANRQMLLAESEGKVTFDEWDQAATLGELECVGADEKQKSLMSWLRSVLTQDVAAKSLWRELE